MGEFFYPQNPKNGLSRIQKPRDYTAPPSLMGRLMSMMPQGKPLGATAKPPGLIAQALNQTKPQPNAASLQAIGPGIQPQSTAGRATPPMRTAGPANHPGPVVGSPRPVAGSGAQRMNPSQYPNISQPSDPFAPHDSMFHQAPKATSPSIAGLKVPTPATATQPQPLRQQAAIPDDVYDHSARPKGWAYHNPRAIPNPPDGMKHPEHDLYFKKGPLRREAYNEVDGYWSPIKPAAAQTPQKGAPQMPAAPNFNTPYFDARRARNAAGQGSPYIPGGNKMTAAQRQEGYAAMAKPASPLAAAMSRPAPQAPQTQFVSRQAEFPQQPSQNPAPGSAPMPQAAAGRPSGQGLQSLTNATEYARYASQGGKKPLMVYSGTGAREGGLQPSLMPARNREEGLARTNRLGEGGVPTPAVAEAQFGGAIPKVDANGRSFFGSAPKAPAFAGGAATPELAARNRLKGMLALQQRNVGNIEAYTDGNGRQQTAFVGERKDGVPRPVGNEVAGRMVAGGISPTTLTPEQLAANKQGMLSRMMAKRTQAGQMRTERAQAQAIARQNQPSPLMQQMLANNPELALKFMEANQRGQALQGQLGNQQAQLALEGRKVDQEAQIARAGLEFKANDSKAEREAKAKGQADLIAADQAKQKDMIAAQQAQQTGNLQFQGKEGEANRANAKDVAAIGAKAAADRIAAEERIKQGSTDAAITAEILKQHPDMSLEEATAFVENRRQGAGGQPSAGPTGGPVAAAPKISEAMKRSYAGGTLKEADYNAVKKFADNGASADELVAMLRSKGLNDEQVGIAINEVMPPNFAANVALAPTGILNLLRGKRFGTNFRSADDPGGWGNALRGRVISPKLRQPPTE